MRHVPGCAYNWRAIQMRDMPQLRPVPKVRVIPLTLAPAAENLFQLPDPYQHQGLDPITPPP